MLEQRGDVVYEVRASEVRASTVAHRRDTVWSALARAAAVALLVLSLWLRMTGAPFASIIAMAGMLAALLASHRWAVEEHLPRPQAAAHRRTYAILRATQGTLFLVFLGVFLWLDRDGDVGQLWILAAVLILGGGLNLFAIEPAFRRLFAQIAEERAAAP